MAFVAYVAVVWWVARRPRRARLAVAFSLAPLAASLVAAAEQDNLAWIVVFAPYAYAFAFYATCPNSASAQ
jgi:hypothetical protein